MFVLPSQQECIDHPVNFWSGLRWVSLGPSINVGLFTEPIFCSHPALGCWYTWGYLGQRRTPAGHQRSFRAICPSRRLICRTPLSLTHCRQSFQFLGLFYSIFNGLITYSRWCADIMRESSLLSVPVYLRCIRITASAERPGFSPGGDGGGGADHAPDSLSTFPITNIFI